MDQLIAKKIRGTGDRKKMLKKLLSQAGDLLTGLRKRSKIVLVIGAWLLVVTIFLAFGL